MEEKKNILLHLYGDESADGELRSSLKNDDLRKEHQALSEVKFRLDHMSRSKPDPGSIDRIMAHATEAAAANAVGARRGDRPAFWRARPLRRVLIPAVSLAAAIVLAVGIGMFGNTPENNITGQPETAADVAAAEAESLRWPNPLVPDQLVRSAGRTSDPLLDWDYAESLMELSRRIETMRPTNELDWGARSIPLEVLPGAAPSGASQQGLRQASSPRQQ